MGSIKENLIRNYVSNINFKSENWGLSQIKEDRVHEAIEYALNLLKKEAENDSASKYFFKNLKTHEVFLTSDFGHE